MPQLTKLQEQLILGGTFGDANIAKHGTYHRVRFVQCEKQQEYLEWKKSILQSFVTMNTLEQTCKKNDKLFKAYSFSTLSREVFTELYYLFYKEGKKTITLDALNRLTPFSLAVWYMDDGCLATEKDSRYGETKFRYRSSIVLGKVSLEDAEIVKQYFISKGIACCICKSYNKQYDRCYPILKLSFPGTRLFQNLIKEFVIPSMQYKLSPIPVTTTRRTPIARVKI